MMGGKQKPQSSAVKEIREFSNGWFETKLGNATKVILGQPRSNAS